jgi:hypothetical protein
MTVPQLPSDIPTIDDEQQQGDGLPRMHWMNGDRKSGTPGFFWTVRENFDEPPGDPWKAQTITFDSGGTAEAYTTPKLRIMAIAYRQQAFTRNRDASGKEVRVYLDRSFSDKGADNQSVLVEVLCLAEGIEGPIVWSSPSIKTSMAIVAPGGILDQVRRDLLRPAQIIWKQKVNRWAFWLPIKTKMVPNKEGNLAIVYEPTKGKPVTPPTVYIPKNDPLSLYVGDDLYRAGYEVWQQYPDWYRQRRGGEPEASGVAVEQPTSGRNVPVPVDEDDMPF